MRRPVKRCKKKKATWWSAETNRRRWGLKSHMLRLVDADADNPTPAQVAAAAKKQGGSAEENAAAAAAVVDMMPASALVSDGQSFFCVAAADAEAFAAQGRGRLRRPRKERLQLRREKRRQLAAAREAAAAAAAASSSSASGAAAAAGAGASSGKAAEDDDAALRRGSFRGRASPFLNGFSSSSASEGTSTSGPDFTTSSDCLSDSSDSPIMSTTDEDDAADGEKADAAATAAAAAAAGPELDNVQRACRTMLRNGRLFSYSHKKVVGVPRGGVGARDMVLPEGGAEPVRALFVRDLSAMAPRSRSGRGVRFIYPIVMALAYGTLDEVRRAPLQARREVSGTSPKTTRAPGVTIRGDDAPLSSGSEDAESDDEVDADDRQRAYTWFRSRFPARFAAPHVAELKFDEDKGGGTDAALRVAQDLVDKNAGTCFELDRPEIDDEPCPAAAFGSGRRQPRLAGLPMHCAWQTVRLEPGQSVSFRGFRLTVVIPALELPREQWPTHCGSNELAGACSPSIRLTHSMRRTKAARG